MYDIVPHKNCEWTVPVGMLVYLSVVILYDKVPDKECNRNCARHSVGQSVRLDVCILYDIVPDKECNRNCARRSDGQSVCPYVCNFYDIVPDKECNRNGTANMQVKPQRTLA